MNKFMKFCPTVWVAECDDEYKKGDIIYIETKHGKEIECKVYNHLGFTGTRENPKYIYSVVRTDEKSYAQKKAEKYGNALTNSKAKSQEWYDKAEEGREFLSLGEPIKVGHHSEKRHRALIDRNWRRIENALECEKKADEQARRAEYWEMKAEEITLAMPESIEFFAVQLEKAKQHHQFLKDNPDKRPHSMSLGYASRHVKDMIKKSEMAKRLWGEEVSK